MKRINDSTGDLYKRGERRSDGYFFWSYTTKLRKDGTFVEIWLHPDRYASMKDRALIYRMSNYARKSNRAPRNSKKLSREELAEAMRVASFKAEINSGHPLTEEDKAFLLTGI